EVWEIGPGSGVLTGQLLVAEARKVVGCELDIAWAFALRSRVRDPRLRIVAADALDIPWHRLPKGSEGAGNLPYNVATAIIDRLLDAHTAVPRAGFLVQLEVAQRLVAQPRAPDYGATSVPVGAQGGEPLCGFPPAPAGARSRGDASAASNRPGRLRLAPQDTAQLARGDLGSG